MMAGKRNTEARFERPTSYQDPDTGELIPTFSTAFTEWVEAKDILPTNRGMEEEVIENGVLRLAKRPCRVRMLYREDVASDMRIYMKGRYWRITQGPAEIGFREGVELMAEDASTGSHELTALET